jgi:tetratricopeptide (TPR) repeat protein
MCSRLKRVSRLAVTSGVFVFFLSFFHVPSTPAQSTNQPVAGTPNWKDRQEYDLFLKMFQTSDPKARLELLNSWQDKYPKSDAVALRLKYYVATLAILAPTTPGERQLLLDKCRELLKLDAKDINALYQASLWGPIVGGASPSSDLLSETDAAARGFISGAEAAFTPANKPAGISDADFAKAMSFRLSVAHNALAWEAIAKKDLQTAETEYKASLTANPEQGTTAAQYAKFLYDQKRYSEALFQYGRAAQYTGPGPALQSPTRSQLMEFFMRSYKNFHGGTDGTDQVLAEARTSALPPQNFSISSAADVAKKEAEELNARIASDPAFGLWYTIRQNLTGDQGDSFFDKTLKDAMIPGGAQGAQTFSGTVISLDLPDRPTKISVGVDDPTKPDATLEFSKPLPDSALDKVKVGRKVEFSGVASAYAKAPYILSFKEPTIVGVQTHVPDKKATHKRN